MPAAHTADTDESHYDFFAWRHASIRTQYRRWDNVWKTRRS
jgi:hypothetical protein